MAEIASKNKKSSLAVLADQLCFKTACLWDSVSLADKKEIEKLSQEYRAFLTEAKTERMVIKKAVEFLAKKGFADLEKKSQKKAGYLTHHGKLAGVFVPGKKSPADGFNLIVTHGDSPRLDLKPKCIYEDPIAGLGLLKTNLYGGLKKHQWLARPLALWGFCALADGRTVDIVFGEDPKDPVLTVADLLPHLDRNVQRGKKVSDAFPAEKMNLLASSIPLGEKGDKNRLKMAILKILHDRWGLCEEDMISSEFEIVPQGPARELGLDASMVGGYGQDDRLATFAALKAVSAVEKPERPTLVVVYDREEIGSYGSTGAANNFIEHLAARAFEAQGLDSKWSNVREALMKTRALSADVEGAIDPDYKDVHEEMNAARLGYGPCLIRYTGGAGKYGASEAGAEFVAQVRGIFNKAGIKWQSSLLGKQEEGGGGTVALYLAHYGMNIVDCGAPLLAMHSPFEVSSKADLWMTEKAYRAFLAS